MNPSPDTGMPWWRRIYAFLTPQRISYGWITGGALWLAWLASVLLGPGLLDLADQVIGTDYIQFHAAGLTLRRGNADLLYDFEYQAQLESEIAGPHLVNFHAFITPPFLAWLFVPFSLFPYAWSFVLWSLLSLLFLWAGLKLLGTRHPVRKFLWALSWFPVFAAISFGQNSLLSLFILSLAYYLWVRQRNFLAGLAASLLLFKPQLLLGIGILWLIRWRRDWRSLVGLVIGTSLIVGASIIWLPSATSTYLKLVQDFLPGLIYLDQFPTYHLHALRGFFISLIPGQIWLAESASIALSILGVLGFAVFYRRHRSEPVLQFAAAVCLTIWITPHAMIYDWALLLIPAVLFWQERPRLKPYWTVVYSILWLVALLSGPLAYIQSLILPFALQISVPVFFILLVISVQHLKQPDPTSSDNR